MKHHTNEPRPLSLHPLPFKEAVADLLKVKPEPKAKPRRRKETAK